MRGDERFDWEKLIPLIVHPDDEKLGLSHVSYHLNRLGAVGALKVVRRRQVRGSIEKFYFFR